MIKTILIAVLALSFGPATAQFSVTPLTPEKVMYRDKVDGTLTKWTETQKESYLADCESKMSEELENSKNYCKCAMKSMMTGLNYSRYSGATDYQKGAYTSMHGNRKCKAIKRKEN